MLNLKDYFHTKNYTAIYLNTLFQWPGRAIIGVFWTVLLYSSWYPIYLILLLYGYMFGLMWALSPLSPILMNRIWLIACVGLGSFFRLIAIFLLLNIWDISIIYTLSLFTFFALDGAIYHPTMHSLISKVVNNSHRGKMNSLNTIIWSLSVIVSVFISWYLLHIEETAILFFYTCISLSLWILSYIILLDAPKIGSKYSFGDVYTYFFSNDFRENITPLGLASFPIIEKFFIPLYIFISLWSMKVLSYIVGFSIIIELIIIWIFWRKIDASDKKSFFWASVTKSLSPILFIISPINPWILFTVKSYGEVTDKNFDNSFWSLLQKKAKKQKDPFLFTTAREMSLCFTELIVLILFAIIAYFVGTYIFLWIFLGSSLAVLIIYKTWKN